MGKRKNPCNPNNTVPAEPRWRGRKSNKQGHSIVPVMPADLSPAEKRILAVLEEKARGTWKSPYRGAMAGTRYLVSKPTARNQHYQTLDMGNLPRYMQLVRIYTQASYTPFLDDVCDAIGVQKSGRTNMSRCLQVLEQEGILKRHGKQFVLADEYAR